MRQLFQAASRERRNSQAGGQKTLVVSLVRNQKDLLYVKELLESQRVVPVIDGCYPLSQAAEALRYFEKEHPRGKVVIVVG